MPAREGVRRVNGYVEKNLVSKLYACFLSHLTFDRVRKTCSIQEVP